MRCLAEFDAVDLHGGRRSRYRISYFDYISIGLISISGGISSYYWRSSGGGAGFIVDAMILASSAARGAAGFLSMNEAHSGATTRCPVEQAFKRDNSFARGVSDATAS